MKFRFTAEHFSELVGVLKTADCIADRANALLEAEEAKCERVHGTVFTERDSMGHLHYWHSEKGDPDHNHTALLWNLQPIGEGE